MPLYILLYNRRTQDWPHTFVSPSAFSRRAVVSYWRKYVHEVLVNRLGGLSLPRKSAVRLIDRPDMTLDVYRGRKTTNQHQQPPNRANRVVVFKGSPIRYSTPFYEPSRLHRDVAKSDILSETKWRFVHGVHHNYSLICLYDRNTVERYDNHPH